MNGLITVTPTASRPATFISTNGVSEMAEAIIYGPGLPRGPPLLAHQRTLRRPLPKRMKDPLECQSNKVHVTVEAR